MYIKTEMIAADEFARMPVLKAITVVDLARIDVHTHLAGAPVTVGTIDGVSYRVPETMQGVARKAFEALAKGCAPELGKGKLCDVLKGLAGKEVEVEHPTLTSVANALAERALDGFAAEFRSVLLRNLKDKHDNVLQEVLGSLLE